jgi:serine phosphatase RsbU (regulator of sigma subunit)
MGWIPTVLLGALVLVVSLVYLRWRRRRLWWIHRQLRSAFIRSALFPLAFGVLMSLVLMFLLLTILTLAMLRLYPEEWLRTALASGETCLIEAHGVVRCGSCRLTQEAVPNAYWTQPGRWWVLPKAFRRWWGRCPGQTLPPGTLLIAVETDAVRLRWGPVREAELTASVERLGIPLAEVWFLYARSDTPVEARQRDSTVSGESSRLDLPKSIRESHLIYVGSRKRQRPTLSIIAPYFLTGPWSGSPSHRPDALTGLLLRVAPLDWIRSALHTPDVLTNLLIKILGVVFLVLLTMTGLVTVGFLASGYWTARRIGRAVNQIEDAMRQVATGHLPIRIPFRRDDQLGRLARQVEQTSQALAFLLEEKVLKDRLDREVEIAWAVQRRFFPASLPAWPGLDIAVHLTPARRLSGDYYDFFTAGSGLRSIVTADVAGKGLPAGLLMASLHALLHLGHRFVRTPEDLVSMFRRVHQHLLEHTEPHQYVTLFYIAFPEGMDRLVYLGAGHPPALYRYGNTLTWLEATGPILGALPDSDWSLKVIYWPPSALLVLYTDGLLETTNPAGHEYGRDRLARRIQDVPPDASAQEIRDGLLADLQAWRGSAEAEDDALLIVIRRT